MGLHPAKIVDRLDRRFHKNWRVIDILEQGYFASRSECINNRVAERSAIARTPAIEIRSNHHGFSVCLDNSEFGLCFRSRIYIYRLRRACFIDKLRIAGEQMI